MPRKVLQTLCWRKSLGGSTFAASCRPRSP